MKYCYSLMRQTETLALLSLVSEHLLVNDEVKKLAITFEQVGLNTLHSIHLTLVSMTKADYFCTYDDKLYRKATVNQGLNSNSDYAIQPDPGD